LSCRWGQVRLRLGLGLGLGLGFRSKLESIIVTLTLTLRRLCPAGTFGSSPGLDSPVCDGLCSEGYYCEQGSADPEQNDCGGVGVFCPLGSREPQVTTSVLGLDVRIKLYLSLSLSHSLSLFFSHSLSLLFKIAACLYRVLFSR
jgi:hypothetical protein